MENGATRFATIRKVPSQASAAGQWVDLSMAAGQPLPQYYADTPLAAAVLDGMRGIFHGQGVSPSGKVLAGMGLMTPTAGLVGAYQLLDYLLYYPFVDLDDLDTQTMDNTVTLPRYTDGAGVRAMLVAVAPTAGGAATFDFDYVNQDGVARTAPIQTYNSTAATIANLLTGDRGVAGGLGAPFLRLADGDTGIRSVTAWRNYAPLGGLAALVLVRPIASHVIREVNTMSEFEYPHMKPGLPSIVDGAYLGLIVNCAATVAAGQLVGFARFAWG
jgi:hypothetical protein